MVGNISDYQKHLPIFLSIYLSIYLYMYLSIYLGISITHRKASAKVFDIADTDSCTDHNSDHDLLDDDLNPGDLDDDVDAGDLEEEIHRAWLQQQMEDNAGHGGGHQADGAKQGQASTNGLSCKLFRDGLLTRGAVLDTLTELAAFHHAPRALMEAVVDIINLVVLDGGAPAPVIPNWKSYETGMLRSTKHIRKKYFVCPDECKEGVTEWKGTVPPKVQSVP